MARDGGDWCWEGCDAEAWLRVTNFLGQIETQTWNELQRAGAHTIAKGISIDQLPAKAQARLRDHFRPAAMPDTLWELHMGGTPRIWGLRTRAVFSVLWWDPDHEVCPSAKRHT